MSRETQALTWVFVSFAIVIALFVLAFIFGGRKIKARMRALGEYARARGLELQGSYPKVHLSGTLHGVPIQLVTREHVQPHGSGASLAYTHEIAATPSVNLGDLAVSREGFFQSRGKVLAGQAIQVGDPAFDQAFAVRSSDPNAARAVLTPNVCAALLQARARAPEIFIEAGAVRTVRGGSPIQLLAPESIDAHLEAAVGVARTFGT